MIRKKYSSLKVGDGFIKSAFFWLVLESQIEGELWRVKYFTPTRMTFHEITYFMYEDFTCDTFLSVDDAT